MSIKMGVYYRSPDDPEAFEKRYLEKHLPMIRNYENLTHASFHKVEREILGDFPYTYVFTGTWEDRDGFRSDMNSEAAAAATKDAQEFAPEFHVVVWEQLA
jgi:uncharacterized protein (TIGR02118 family)